MATDGKESKEKKSKAPKTDGVDVEKTGRVAKARSAVSSGASRLASGVSNNKKSLGIGAAAAVAAAGVVAVVKARKKSAATSSALETTTPEAAAESTLGTDGTAAEPLV